MRASRTPEERPGVEENATALREYAERQHPPEGRARVLDKGAEELPHHAPAPPQRPWVLGFWCHCHGSWRGGWRLWGAKLWPIGPNRRHCWFQPSAASTWIGAWINSAAQTLAGSDSERGCKQIGSAARGEWLARHGRPRCNRVRVRRRSARSAASTHLGQTIGITTNSDDQLHGGLFRSKEYLYCLLILLISAEKRFQRGGPAVCTAAHTD